MRPPNHLEQLREYLKLNGIRYPAVLLGSGDNSYTTVMTSSDLNACAGDPKALTEKLRQENVLTQSKRTSSL